MISLYTQQSLSASKKGNFKKAKQFGFIALGLSIGALVTGFIEHIIGWVGFAYHIGEIFACGLTPSRGDPYCYHG